MSKKSRVKGDFDKQEGKRAQAVLNSASQNLDHIHRSLPRKLIWTKVSLIDMPNLGKFC